MTHSQDPQHSPPSMQHYFAGQHGQPFAPPRVMANAGGGPVVEANVGQLDLVQDAGDEAAHARDGHLVVTL